MNIRNNNEQTEDSGDQNIYLLSNTLTVADLWLFQTVCGLLHAFPTRMAQLADSLTLVMRHYEQVSQRERIAAYLASPRRASFENYIFRFYAELDDLAKEEETEEGKAES